jgi:hypothetical protein
MTYHFAQPAILGILIVHKKKFRTTEEAQTWNKRTGICKNFDLMTPEEVEEWVGEVIWVPIQNKRGGS